MQIDFKKRSTKDEKTIDKNEKPTKEQTVQAETEEKPKKSRRNPRKH
jgi:hypothetical protein